MKGIITTTQHMFVRGGAEMCADNLKSALIKAGHQAEIVSMPYAAHRPELFADHVAAARLMNVSSSMAGTIDLCIGLKFPAYFMPHPNKVLWLLHQQRALYDLYNTEYGVPDNAEQRAMRAAVMRADDMYLREAKRIYTIAQNVSNRLQRYNGIASTPVYHPSPGMENMYAGEYGDYILLPSRISSTKRQMLAVEALSRCKQDVKLYIMGRPDAPSLLSDLEAEVHRYKVQDKVKILTNVDDDEKLKLDAGAKAVLFIPVDGDYGYITLEAMAAARPLITTTDAGGPLEFVQPEETGSVVQPKAEEIAAAMDALWSSRTMAADYGRAGRHRLDEMDITWENVVRELTRP